MITIHKNMNENLRNKNNLTTLSTEDGLDGFIQLFLLSSIHIVDSSNFNPRREQARSPLIDPLSSTKYVDITLH